MKDLVALWNKVNNKFDVLFFMALIIVALDGWLGFLAFQTSGEGEVFLSEYSRLKNLPPKKKFIPPKEKEVEPFDPDKMVDIPDDYKVIITNNVYVNPDITKIAGFGEDMQTQVLSQYDPGEIINILENKEDLPPIIGYRVKGLVKSIFEKEKIGAVQIESKSGQTFYGKEGEKLFGTRITVKSIDKNRVILSQPGYKDTAIYYKDEKLLARWKSDEYEDPFAKKEESEYVRSKPKKQEYNSNNDKDDEKNDGGEEDSIEDDKKNGSGDDENLEDEESDNEEELE